MNFNVLFLTDLVTMLLEISYGNMINDTTKFPTMQKLLNHIPKKGKVISRLLSFYQVRVVHSHTERIGGMK